MAAAATRASASAAPAVHLRRELRPLEHLGDDADDELARVHVGVRDLARHDLRDGNAPAVVAEGAPSCTFSCARFAEKRREAEMNRRK
eukprot:5590845-Pleurochrysis_carterae.AAC.1